MLIFREPQQRSACKVYLKSCNRQISANEYKFRHYGSLDVRTEIKEKGI